MNPTAENDREKAGLDAPAPGLIVEFWEFLCHNRKWWLLPILLVLLLFGILVVLSGTGAAPFIYTFH